MSVIALHRSRKEHNHVESNKCVPFGHLHDRSCTLCYTDSSRVMITNDNNNTETSNCSLAFRVGNNKRSLVYPFVEILRLKMVSCRSWSEETRTWKLCIRFWCFELHCVVWKVCNEIETKRRKKERNVMVLYFGKTDVFSSDACFMCPLFRSRIHSLIPRLLSS